MGPSKRCDKGCLREADEDGQEVELLGWGWQTYGKRMVEEMTCPNVKLKFTPSSSSEA